MRLISLSLMFILLTSCARLSYVLNQAGGQVDLELRGRDNREVLNDPEVSKPHKEKIEKIIAYKKFFESFFDVKLGAIYEQTSFLDDEAVSYLVVASPKNKIKPLVHSFPIVGSFPYLGFFDKSEAKDFFNELKSENYDVYLRPVYAYSTLGQLFFDDNILSSFFYFDDVTLAELIFHELFHTLFFVPGEVGLNENLAQFFARSLVPLYFDGHVVKSWKAQAEQSKLIYQELNRLVKLLEKKYDLVAESELENLRQREFKHINLAFKEFCQKNKIQRCWPSKVKWNNARLVSYLTYEAKQDFIEKMYHQQQRKDLKSFFFKIQKAHESFQESNNDISFEEFLKRQ